MTHKKKDLAAARGHREVVEDAENGYLVTPDRPAEMAERACPRLGDARVRQCLGSEVREAVANHCGPNA